jgi:hypothetical protein
MEYLNIKQSAAHIGKSVSTIRNLVRTIRASEKGEHNGKPIIKLELLANKSKQVYLLVEYLDTLVKDDTSDNTHITPENDTLIASLHAHIETLKKELENRNRQIDEFLILEQKAIDRIKEQNHIIYQLNNKAIESSTTPAANSFEYEEASEVDFETQQNLSKQRADILSDMLKKAEH